MSDIEKLLEEQSQFEAENPDPYKHPAGPFFQAVAKDKLEKEREAYDAGDNMALLAAIRICANHDMVIPEWASKGFIAAYDKVLNCQTNSWDDAFGEPYPGKQVNRLMQRRNNKPAVFTGVRKLQNEKPGLPLMSNKDVTGIFDIVAKDLGIGPTICRELYYEAEKEMTLPQKP